jgi:PKD repeat protein
MRLSYFLFWVLLILIAGKISKAEYLETFDTHTYFFKNHGEVNKRYEYCLKSSFSSTYFFKDGLVHQFLPNINNSDTITNSVINLGVEFLGSLSSVKFIEIDPQEAKINFFHGNDRANWHSDVSTFKTLKYKDLYYSIDAIYYNYSKGVKNDFVVHKGGSLSDIKIKYSGVKKLFLNDDGSLKIISDAGEITERIPEAYQIINGNKKNIDARYTLDKTGIIGFEANNYNPNFDLIIDPQLIYSTYFGGSNTEGLPRKLIRDSQGNIYFIGRTLSTDFPVTVGSFSTVLKGYYDIVVSKFTPNCSQLIFSTYIGSSDEDGARTMQLTGSNNDLLISGITGANDFPIVGTVYQPVYGGGTHDVFVLKLNNTGNNIIFSTYLGGTFDDQIGFIKTDASGRIYIAGYASNGFPTTPGAYQTSCAGNYDAYVSILSSDVDSLLYSTYIGGASTERGISITLDNNGNVYFLIWITGDFPTTTGAYDNTFNGGNDIAVCKFNPTLSTPIYSTIIGGPSNDIGLSYLYLDSDNNVIFTGQGGSGFPTTAGAYDQTYNGGTTDGIIVKLNSTGTNLLYSSFLGGPGTDDINDLDYNSGILSLTGYCQDGFPITDNAYDETYNGGSYDCFLSKFDINSSQLIYSTYVGGSDDDKGICITNSGDTLMVAGETCSSNFPVTSNAYDQIYNSNTDFFILKLNPTNSTATASFTSPDTVCVNQSITIQNNSQGASTYYWNFCSGNLASDPLGINMGNLGSLNGPVYSDIVKDGNNYYVFVTNHYDGTITRLSFGSSLMNTPTATNLGNLGILSIMIEGIQINMDYVTNNWYGLIASHDYLFRLNFGNSLNNTPTAENLGNFGGLIYFGHTLFTFYEGGNWYCLMGNYNANTILRLSFGNSLSNTPTGVNLGNVGSLNGPTGFYPVNVNGAWSLFVVNRNSNTLSRLDFGNSLLNTPTGTNLGNLGGAMNTPRSITMIRDCENVTGFVVNEVPNDIVRLTFPNGIFSTPSGSSLGNIAGFSFPHNISEVFRVGDSLYAFVMNVSNSTISRLCFPSCNNASIASSTLQNPPAYSYNSAGLYNVHLVVNEGLPDQASACKAIVVLSPPVAVITGVTNVCAGQTINLYSTSYPSATYSWTGPNGYSSSNQNITIPNSIAANAGIYTLIVTQGDCVSEPASVTVTVNDPPATFAGEDITMCTTAASIQLTGASSGTGATLLWSSSGTGTFNNTAILNPIYTPSNTDITSGSVILTLTGTTLPCSPTSDQLTLFFSQPPSANAGSNNNTCQGVPYTVTDASAQNYTSILWTHNGTGTLTNATTLTPTYNPGSGEIGIVTLNMTVSNGTVCPVATDQVNLTILLAPVANAGPNATICSGNIYTITGASATNGLTFTWSHNGSGSLSGTTTLSPTYTPGPGETGTVTITLTVTGNPPCTVSTDYMLLQILTNPTAFFSFPSVVCIGNSLPFTDLSSTPVGFGYITTWLWDFGDGNSQTITFPNSPNIAHTYSSAGTFNVTLTVTTSNLCTDSFNLPVTVSPNPVANFSYTGQCEGTIVEFNDISTPNNGGSIVSWSWNFGDPSSGVNNTSNFQNPTHSYTASGTYLVSLTATNSSGCTNTYTAQVVIYSLPSVEFGWSDACLNGMTYFTPDPNIVNIGAVSSWLWNFGDGNTSTLQNSTNVYSTPGTYGVSLSITDTLGCQFTLTKTLSIHPLPVAHYDHSNINCTNTPVMFQDLSYTSWGYINRWIWDFGDGNTQTIDFPDNPNISHNYLSSGNYTVTLTVVSSDNCSSFENQTVIINPNPLADFIAPDICDGYPLQFTDISQAAVGTIISWNWDFGDPLSDSSNLSNLQNPEHLFSAPGQFTITLIVESSSSCFDTISKSVTVSPYPIVNAGTDAPFCESDTYTLSGSTLNTTSLHWTTLGDGTIINPVSLQPVYTPGTNDKANGIVKLVLTGYGSAACSGETVTDTIQLSIDPMPVVYAGPYGAYCVKDPVQINGANASNFSSLTWSGGDGTFNNPTIITPTYLPGNNDFINGYVTLTLSANGTLTCSLKTVSDTAKISVTKHPVVFAGNDDYICSDYPPYQIQSSAQDIDFSRIRWSFSGGDGHLSDSTILAPVYYPGPIDLTTIDRKIIFKLTAYGLGNCYNTQVTDSAQLLIDPVPIAYAGIDGEVCGTGSFTLSQSSAMYQKSITWTTNGNGTFDNISLLHSTYFPNPTDQGNLVMLKLNLLGCMNLYSSDSLYLNVHPNPSVSILSYIDICEGTSTPLTITFTGTPPWDVTYTNGLIPVTVTGITTSPYTFTVSPLLTSNYWITAASDAYCAVPNDSIHGPAYITVHELPHLFTTTATNGGYYCAGDTGVEISLSSSQVGMTYELFHNWVSTGMVLPGTGNTIHFGAFTAPGQYAVEGTNPGGPCTAWMRDTVEVIINPIPVTDFTWNTACMGDTTIIDISGFYINAVSDWLWDFGDGTYLTLNAPVNTVKHVFSTYGTYIVTLSVTDTNGCYYSINHEVMVRPHPTAFFSYDTPNCLGDVTTFTDLSTIPAGQGYLQRWIWDYGDGTAKDTVYFPGSPNVTHTYATNGTYTVTLQVTNSVDCGDTWSTTVTVTRRPVAEFTMAATACQEMGVVFHDLSGEDGGGAIVNWSWDFGDPTSGVLNFSGDKDPVHSYATAGNYTVTLIVTNYNGCSDTLQKPIEVFGKPAAGFDFGAGCVGDTTLLWADMTIINGGAIAGYHWDFGDGKTSSSPTTFNIYNAPGTYTVTLTVTDTSGCENDTSRYLIITTPPVAHFSAPANNCLSETIHFSDLSNANDGYITTWTWDFGDGNTQTILFPDPPDVSHDYTASGTFPVTLTVTDSYGCKQQEERLITVNDSPEAVFMYQGGSCEGSQVLFTDLSTATGYQEVTGWQWDFGDPASGVYNSSTLQNPVHTFNGAGTYTVQLIAYTGNLCSDTTTRQISITTLPGAGFTTQQACRDNPVQFSPDYTVTDTTVIATWLWDFGDGGTSTLREPVHSYNVSATYMVTLTVGDTSGCERSVTVPVTILPLPEVNFTYDSPVCEGTTVQFTDLTTVPGQSGYVYRRTWDFGDGTSQTILFPNATDVTHTYGQAGTFTVTLTAVTADSCTAVTAKTVTVLPQPAAAFVHGAGCEGMAMQFTNLSMVTGGQSLSGYLWDFGDPGSGTANQSTQTNPGHSYNTAGTYTVMLIAMTANGCSDTATQQVTVSPPPAVDFTMAAQCSGDTTWFTSSSLVNVAATQSWLWQFGDGGTATIADPMHIYSQQGTYTVILTITDTAGCSNTISYPLTIQAAPQAWFSVTAPGCSGMAVTFTDLTNANGGTIINWYWQFGDGHDTTFTASTPTFTHTYTNAGVYTATLSVTTQQGCENTYQQTITISSSPLTAFSWQNTCQGQATQFSDMTTLNGGATLVSWSWNFGDAASGTGNSSQLQNPWHTYTLPGTYVVTLTTMNASGCSDTAQSNVTISTMPAVDFYHDNTTCKGVSVTFHTDTVVANIDALQTYDWDFGDGTAHAYTVNPTHTYQNAGTYTVTLLVTDTVGCPNAVSHSITIHASPQAQFSYTNVCAGTATLFSDLSLAPQGDTIVSWQWDFGDTQQTTDTSTLQNPEYTYTQTGTYTVTLAVMTEHGCENSIAIPLQVWNRPTASFNYATTPCAGGTVQFADSSWSYQGTITGWQWEFEPYQYGSGQNPQHTYYATDSCYTVQLVVTDSRGCIDTTQQQVCVPAPLQIAMTYQQHCYGEPAQFVPQLITPEGDSLITFAWNFGDPASGSQNTSVQKTPQHLFTQTGYYSVHLTTTDWYGCMADTWQQVQVYALPQPSFTWENGSCDTTVTFASTSQDTTAAITTMIWEYGDGTTDTIYSPNTGVTHHYGYPGEYTVTLTTVNANGCSAQAEQTVQRSSCLVAAMVAGDTLLCQNTPVQFTDMSTCDGTITQWTWYWGDGTTDTYTQYKPYNQHTFTTSGTFTISLVVMTDVNGTQITDSTTSQVMIIPSPMAGFTAKDVCLGEKAWFNDTTLANGALALTYRWDFGDGTTTSDTSELKNPGYQYPWPGTFEVQQVVSNQLGCSDTVSSEINVNGLPQAAFDNSMACQGHEVYFFDHSQAYLAPLSRWGWLVTGEDQMGMMNGATPSFVFSAAGDYTVTLTVADSNRCIDTIIKQITVNTVPVSAFTVTENYENQQGQVLFTNGSVGALQYYWDFGNGETSMSLSPVVTYSSDGNYTVQLITVNSLGCTDTATTVYRMLYKGLWIPNAMAPSGPVEQTRLWKPVGVNLATYRAEVYNSHGILLWSSEKLDSNGVPVEGWDGTYKQVPCQQDVYVWKVQAVFRDGTIWHNENVGESNNMPDSEWGTVTLIR